jgi:hypothetical protein
VRNAFEVHRVNKQNRDAEFVLQGKTRGKLRFTIALPKIVLPELGDQRIPVFIDFAQGSVQSGERADIELLMDGQVVRLLRAPLLAPRAACASRQLQSLLLGVW